ncbi:putative quinol monooxygenase [Phenylobacterium sp.]|uniref:putative quinol monooxygenase n=1 Tax=Phenylobacterium sp. TaxID=1871053 RepID=UPI002FE1C340
MTIGVIARVKIAPGQEQAFEALFAEQAEQVRANEPANRLYRLFRDRAEPGGYIVMEIYDDEAALEAHRAAPHMLANRPRMAPLLGGKTVVEIYDAA